MTDKGARRGGSAWVAEADERDIGVLARRFSASHRDRVDDGREHARVRVLPRAVREDTASDGLVNELLRSTVPLVSAAVSIVSVAMRSNRHLVLLP